MCFCFTCTNVRTCTVYQVSCFVLYTWIRTQLAALVAQLVERSPRTRSVVGSNPTQGSFFFEKRESCSGCIYLPCFDLSCMPLSLDLGVFGGLIILAFSFRLSLSSPVYQVSCFVLYTWIRTQPAELPW